MDRDYRNQQAHATRTILMIRFIDLGKQIALDEDDEEWPRQFAFFDTIYSQFVKINGYVVFDSLNDLLTEMQQDETGLITVEFANRLLSLCPDWLVVQVAKPRQMMIVEGIK